MRSLSSILKVRRGGDIGDWTDISSGFSYVLKKIDYGNGYWVISSYEIGVSSYSLHSNSPSVSWTSTALTGGQTENSNFINNQFAISDRGGGTGYVHYGFDPSLGWTTTSGGRGFYGATYSSDDNLYVLSCFYMSGSTLVIGVAYGSSLAGPFSYNYTIRRIGQSYPAGVVYNNGYYTQAIAKGRIYYATHPGSTWTQSSASATNVKYLNGYLVAPGNRSGPLGRIFYIYDTPNGTWNQSNLDDEVGDLYDVTYHKGYYIVVGQLRDYSTGCIFYASSLAGPWTKANIASGTSLRGVHSNGDKAIAVGLRGRMVICDF